MAFLQACYKTLVLLRTRVIYPSSQWLELVLDLLLVRILQSCFYLKKRPRILSAICEKFRSNLAALSSVERLGCRRLFFGDNKAADGFYRKVEGKQEKYGDCLVDKINKVNTSLCKNFYRIVFKNDKADQR